MLFNKEEMGTEMVGRDDKKLEACLLIRVFSVCVFIKIYSSVEFILVLVVELYL